MIALLMARIDATRADNALGQLVNAYFRQSRLAGSARGPVMGQGEGFRESPPCVRGLRRPAQAGKPDELKETQRDAVRKRKAT